MKTSPALLSLLISAVLLAVTAGCPTKSSSDGNADGAHAADGGDDHGHSHDVPGPAGGHLLEIGDEEYHVEWVHDEDDDSVVEFIVRDDLAKEEVPIEAEQLYLQFTITDAAGKKTTGDPVEIPAVGRTDENPKTARFELKDPIAIANLLGGSKDIKAVLKITIDGVEYEKEIEHAAHGHGHSHSH